MRRIRACIVQRMRDREACPEAPVSIRVGTHCPCGSRVARRHMQHPAIRVTQASSDRRLHAQGDPHGA
eukprot:68727-Prymnesium_polylepis.1